MLASDQGAEYNIFDAYRQHRQGVRRFLAPMWVAVLSPALLKERPGKFTFVAIPLCLLGVVLIAHGNPGDISMHHVRTIGIIVAIFQVCNGMPQALGRWSVSRLILPSGVTLIICVRLRSCGFDPVTAPDVLVLSTTPSALPYLP